MVHGSGANTCRCGYSTPAVLVRCLGCGRRLARCARGPSASPPSDRRTRPTVARRPASSAVPTHSSAAGPRRPDAETGGGGSGSPWSRRDASRFGAPPPAAPAPTAVAVGPLAVVGLVAAAWIGPEAPRAELLTVAALIGAATATVRPSSSTPVPGTGVDAGRPAVAPTRLTDDELRDAITAW